VEPLRHFSPRITLCKALGVLCLQVLCGTSFPLLVAQCGGVGAIHGTTNAVVPNTQLLPHLTAPSVVVNSR
jgi:hypothetical protein